MDTIRTTDESPLREINGSTDSRDVLAHARRETKERELDDYLIVDVDAHCYETENWAQLVEYIPDEVVRDLAKSFITGGRSASGIIQSSGFPNYQRVAGRITPGKVVTAEGEEIAVARARHAMDAMGIDYQVVFPTPLLSLGMHRQSAVESNIAWAYNRWMIERICVQDERVKALIYLPFNDPKACQRIVEEQAHLPGVVGAMVTSVRHKAVHHNDYMPIYAMLQERDLPLLFHAGPHWEETGYIAQLNQFIGAHAISFVLCNMVHLTNWVLNAMPERFPKLRVGWIESGITWLGFLSTRLDNEYSMRTSEAPGLKKLPSEYIKEMFYTTQPMERGNMKVLEASCDAINAKTQLVYASDWPHWDFDLPGTVLDLPFLDEESKRNILGMNAARLFGIDPSTLRKGLAAAAE